MNEGLEALHHPRIKMAKVDISAEGKRGIAYMFFDDTKQYAAIEKELRDYQEIREIAKRYNWDDITSEVFNVKTDKKYRDLFNSAIINIQEDYRKARALEIIKRKVVLVDVLVESENANDYNEFVSKSIDRHLTQGEYDLLKEVLKDD